MDIGRLFAYPDQQIAAAEDSGPFLADRGPQDWARLLAQSTTQRLQPGDVLMHVGDVDRALYIVASGDLEVLVPARRSTVRVAVVRPGSILGELAFFDASPRSATVRALTQVEVHRLSLDNFDRLAAQDPELARAIIFDLGRILATRLRLMDRMVAR